MDPMGKVKIQLESGSVVSGEHLKGFIISKSTSKGLKVSFRLIGIENMKIYKETDNVKEINQTVIDYTEVLSHKTNKDQEVFPFKLNVPKYLPSSFTLAHELDKYNRKIEACIFYRIIASLESSAGKLAEKNKDIVVINSEVRESNNRESSIVSILKSCWCIPRGGVKISIKKTDDQNIIEDHQFKYNLLISSKHNSKLESIVAQIVFEFVMKVPGEKSVKSRKNITRVVPNLSEFKRELMANEDISLDLEFSSTDEKSLDAYSVTKGNLFRSRVYLKICTIYNIGWRSKFFELDHNIFVPPRIKNTMMAGEDIEEYKEYKEVVISPGDEKAALYADNND